MDGEDSRIEKNFQNMFGEKSGQECRNGPRKHQQQEDSGRG